MWNSYIRLNLKISTAYDTSVASFSLRFGPISCSRISWNDDKTSRSWTAGNYDTSTMDLVSRFAPNRWAIANLSKNWNARRATPC